LRNLSFEVKDLQTQKLKSHAHVALVYKNFAAQSGISHIGLGVAAVNNAKVLTKHGVRTSIWPLSTPAQLAEKIRNATNPVTDVVVSAPWIPTTELLKLIQDFPDVEFVVNCHSNVGFLQADPNGVKLLRENIDLEQGNLNFRVAGNSIKFNRWLREAYQAPSLYLPNMYYVDYSHRIRPPYYDGGVLRIGAFGAIRPQKNIMSAAGAAISLANEIKADVELWISSGRAEGGVNTMLNAVREMMIGVPGIKLMELPWRSWPAFRDTLRRMHILFQVSYTESFNMVTADGIAEGVTSVVSEAINWAPNRWKANIDDVQEIADVGRNLLFDKMAPMEGLKALERHNSEGFGAWMTGLNIDDCSGYNALLQDPFLL
jgi:glycosyltransferase involved in cell wall biosynthesis